MIKHKKTKCPAKMRKKKYETNQIKRQKTTEKQTRKY